MFPHDFLDEGLGAVGLFIDSLPKNAGYKQTPINSITFAGTGGDGVHFGFLGASETVKANCPVVVTIPMANHQWNFIVGESLHDFLCLGCKVGFSQLGRLDLDYDLVVEHYSLDALADSQDLERRTRILELLSQEFSLEPWTDVSTKLRRLKATWHKTIQNTC
jgi:hypothetical protein